MRDWREDPKIHRIARLCSNDYSTVIISAKWVLITKFSKGSKRCHMAANLALNDKEHSTHAVMGGTRVHSQLYY